MNNWMKWLIAAAALAAAACSVTEDDAAKAPASVPGALDSSKGDWRTRFYTEVRANVDVGAPHYDRYDADAHYYGYTFELAEGDVVDVVVGDDGTGFDPVIGLYGPQGAGGEWGALLAANDDHPAGGTYDSYLQYAADEAGLYLVLVREYGYSTGDFFVSIECAGGTCSDPAPTCDGGGVFCALWCPNGFKSDDNGCPVCACADDPIPPVVCADGETRPAGDGCNTCTCSGGSWACTEMACLPGDECETDADCITTGCSGQICAPEAVFTTCEFRAEYACYREPTTSCGCNHGTCGWARTADLAQCLAGN